MTSDVTRKQAAKLTKREAILMVEVAVYQATAMVEQLELAGKISGNGHHARQAIASAAGAEFALRWNDNEGVKSDGQ